MPTRPAAMKRAASLGTTVLAFAIVAAVWELVARFGGYPPKLVPGLGTILDAFIRLAGSGVLLAATEATLFRLLTGFLLAATVGVVLGILMGRFQWVEDTLLPIVAFAYPIPGLAYAPLFVLWFGLGIAGKAALVVSLVFFVMLTTTLAGLTQPNKDYEYLARSLGSSRRQHILYFIVPAAVPTIVAGLELSLTYSFLGAVAGEIVGGSYGIGVRLTAFANAFEIDKFMALLLLLVIMSTATVQLMRHFTAKLTRWHATEQGDVH